jgi:hypothetical protein
VLRVGQLFRGQARIRASFTVFFGPTAPREDPQWHALCVATVCLMEAASSGEGGEPISKPMADYGAFQPMLTR